MAPVPLPDGLEIVIGNTADCGGGREHGGRHAVAPGHVLGAPLGIETVAAQGKVAQVDRIEIVAVPLAADQLDARIERLFKPQGVEVVGRHRQQQRNAVVGADFGESAGGVARRGDHQHPVGMFLGAGAYAVSLGLLERTGGHPGSDGGMVAVESDVEVLQPQIPGQSLAFVGYGRGRALEHPLHGQPVGEFVNPVVFGSDLESAFGVNGAHQRGHLARRVVERPSFVGKFAARGDAAKRVGGGCKFFHLFRFA